MLEFYDIEIEDLKKIREIISNNNIISSLYSVYNLYALRKKYNTKIAYDNNTLYIQQINRNSYLYPIGSEDLKISINKLQEHAKMNNYKFNLWGLTSEMVDRLEDKYPNTFIIKEIPDWSDYIYETDKLFNNKIIKKHRKFISQNNNRYEIEKISKSNIKEIIEFQHKWMKDNADDSDDIVSLNFENESILESLTIWDKLPLIGFCVKVDGIIVAFDYGFMQTPDCFMIHVIKTDKTIKGLTPFIFKYLIEAINVKYINFEEDIGIEGLRTFKTRLEPSFMLKKYKAILDI